MIGKFRDRTPDVKLDVALKVPDCTLVPKNPDRSVIVIDHDVLFAPPILRLVLPLVGPLIVTLDIAIQNTSNHSRLTARDYL